MRLEINRCSDGWCGVVVVVAYYVEGRSREQCAKRWEQLYPTNTIRGRWQDHEDAVSLICSSSSSSSCCSSSSSSSSVVSSVLSAGSSCIQQTPSEVAGRTTRTP